MRNSSYIVSAKGVQIKRAASNMQPEGAGKRRASTSKLVLPSTSAFEPLLAQRSQGALGSPRVARCNRLHRFSCQKAVPGMDSDEYPWNLLGARRRR